MEKFILMNDEKKMKEVYQVKAHKVLYITGQDLLITMDVHEGETDGGKVGIAIDLKISNTFSNELLMKAASGTSFKIIDEKIRLVVEGARADEKKLTRFLLKKIKEKKLDQLERDQSLFDEKKIEKYWKEMYVS